MLISAEQLKKEMNSGLSLLLFDCRFAMPAVRYDADFGHNQYLQGHIPGSSYVNLDKDLSAASGPNTGRHPLPAGAEFLDKLQKWGLEPGVKVVIYDDCGALIAGRFWWMLRYWVGHRNVVILDGGFRAWCQSGLELEEKVHTRKASAYRYQTSPQHLKTTADIKQLLDQSQTRVIVDARGHSRFTGEDETIDLVAGHIPGAVNVPCVDNLSADGRFLPAERLHQRFFPLLTKVSHAHQIIHNCGSGVTACHNILAMDIAGISATSLYAGSWSEWIKYTDNPVAVGEGDAE